MRNCRRASPAGLPHEGYPADHVSDLGTGPATDSQIEAEARRLGAVIWSKDVDFAERARLKPGLQVVWIRLGNTTDAALRARLAAALARAWKPWLSRSRRVNDADRNPLTGAARSKAGESNTARS